MFDEISQLHERLSNILRSFSEVAFQPFPDVESQIIELCVKSIDFTVPSTLFQAITDEILQMQKDLAALCSDINFQAISDAIRVFEHAHKSLIDSLLDVQSFQPIFDSISNTLALVEPYFPPDTKAECEDIILPKQAKEHKGKLSLSDLLSMLNLLVAIFFGLVSLMPNPDASLIAAQNEVIVEQSKEIQQLRKDDAALLDALNSLTDSINLLSNEVDLLREELEGPSDSFDSPSQGDPGNT